MVTFGVRVEEDLKERIDATAARLQMTSADMVRGILDISLGFTTEKLEYNFELLKRQSAMNDEGRRQLEEQSRVAATLRQQFIDLRSMNAARAARVHGVPAVTAAVARETGKVN